MKKIFLYPIWLRIWHWLNALLFVVLILSGMSLHYSGSGDFLFSFEVSMIAHNTAGIALSFIYLIYFIMNIFSGNIKHYLPSLKNFIGRSIKQARFYTFGIFLGEPHPYHASEKEKFNPMQQMAYFFVVFIGFPVIILSGWFLMFPEIAPDEIFGMGGVWPMAMLHTVMGFFLTIFMFAHIYLATTGNTPTELFVSMFTGYHIAHEDETDALETDELPSLLLNPISLVGAFITMLSLVFIVLLLIFEFTVGTNNPYTKLITYIIIPTVLGFGLIIILFGWLKENKNKDKPRKRLPMLDFNRAKHQLFFFLFSVMSFTVVITTIYGSRKAYEFTESNTFCMEACHEVMEPVSVTYASSAHSKIACVDCHFTEKKSLWDQNRLSGLPQVYMTLTDSYDKPLGAPTTYLRPSAEACKKCHWEEKFYDQKSFTKDYFLSDEDNSHYQITLTMKVGGGNREIGISSGIHYHMGIGKDISYIEPEKEGDAIPLVRAISNSDGKETVYRLLGNQISPNAKFKQFDCIDCHNRPSHSYNDPYQTINAYMAYDKINSKLPNIKKVGVRVLESLKSRENSLSEIKNFITDYYRTNFPNILVEMRDELNFAAIELNSIYLKNYFPEMNANWKVYANHESHLYSKGCFRCHDGNHVDKSGNVLSNDCNICHTITTKLVSGMPVPDSLNSNKFLHPGGLDKDIINQYCSDCHNPQ